MKFLIASDIHGSFISTQKILDSAKQFNVDKIVLLGDVYYHGPRNVIPDYYDPKKVSALLNENVDKLIVVRGNCDSQVDAMISDFEFVDQAIITLGTKSIFLTHGHIFNMDNPPKGEYNAVIYGHFHTGFIEKLNGKIFANAGSVTLPKNQTPKSFIIADENKLTLYNLENEKIKEQSY